MTQESENHLDLPRSTPIRGKWQITLCTPLVRGSVFHSHLCLRPSCLKCTQLQMPAMVKMCIYYHTGVVFRCYICLNASRVFVTISTNGLNPFFLFCFVAVNQKTSFVCSKCSSVLGPENEIAVKTFLSKLFFPPHVAVLFTFREMFRTKIMKVKPGKQAASAPLLMVFTVPSTQPQMNSCCELMTARKL